MCPKTKLSTVKFRRIQKLSFCKVYEKLLGAISRFMRLKRSCLPVKLRRSLEFFACKVCKKKFWAHFHDLCVTQTDILDFKIL